MNSPWWNWTSSVWLVVAAMLAAYPVIVRDRTAVRWLALIGGAAVLALAYVSPVGVLAEGYLFSAHMAQHLVLLLVLPVCLLMSLPRGRAASGGDGSAGDRTARFFARPGVGWACGVGAMWLWHVPQLCSAAVGSPALGVLRDVSLVAAGLAFWWPIYAPSDRYRLPPLTGILYLFSACLACTLLGVYITFATLSVCPAFASPVDRIGVLGSLYDMGITPGVDQHLAGLLMWVPPCVLYTGAIVGLLSRWYAETEQEFGGATGAANQTVGTP
ncbi:Cytochrome c oxidase caa3 assembly factor (Caa3_CtaG) [Pirellulimonas nuda]|uniref:Cytochrome c oxidase caa3 assembly factor (Caa3_CtaG) n=1 Tax=Pirellulimonas nuda TaxID=2528009 RepID=A0A518D8U5_9BACT|nr:cytochrome c oxidase assembly protein [Pirellulimonas nuda]QDU87895.1 Cytochrome c oxidase caa3 assembly factor (Caa3_CtaG) [Pirellulimonas nuda]